MAAVEDFLDHYNARDFDRLAGCFSSHGFHRVGPFGDTISSSAEYVEFLRRVVPTLGPDYKLETERIVYANRTANGTANGTAIAELIEHFEVDGTMRKTPEAIVFDLDADGLIAGMRLYVQRPNDVPPAGGRDAMGSRAD